MNRLAHRVAARYIQAAGMPRWIANMIKGCLAEYNPRVSENDVRDLSGREPLTDEDLVYLLIKPDEWNLNKHLDDSFTESFPLDSQFDYDAFRAKPTSEGLDFYGRFQGVGEYAEYSPESLMTNVGLKKVRSYAQGDVVSFSGSFDISDHLDFILKRLTPESLKQNVRDQVAAIRSDR